MLGHGARNGAQATSATPGSGASPFRGDLSPLAAEQQRNDNIGSRDPQARVATVPETRGFVRKEQEFPHNPWVQPNVPETVRTTLGSMNFQVGQRQIGPEVHHMTTLSEEFVSFEGQEPRGKPAPSSSSRETPS